MVRIPSIRPNITLVLTLAVLLVSATAPAVAQKGKTGRMSTPQLGSGATTATSVEVLVCAGATGAPAGFSLQWLTADDLAALAGAWPSSDDAALCKGSFSGNANLSPYDLAAGQCVTVQLGDNLFDDAGASSNCASLPLTCGTEYAVRGFAHANSSLFRSDFTPTFFVSTQPCTVEAGCTLTQGYWKTHGPVPSGNNVNEWAVTSLTLGSVTYTDLELQAIFDTPAKGNGLISLAHQLIAAKLNAANGADTSAVQTAIDAADALIGDLMVPPVGTGTLSSAATSSLTAALDSFNSGLIGPGHCS